MMKKVLGLTLAAIAMMSFGASAQTVNASENAKAVKSEKVAKSKRDCKSENAEAKCVKATKDCAKDCAKKGKDKKGQARQGKDGQKMGAPRAINPESAFEGINLTDAQKASLKQLNEKRMARRTEMKAQAKEQTDAQKEAARKNKEAMKADRQKAQKEYLEEVKEIIGPDNYVVFLENLVVNQQPQKAQAHNGHAKKGHGQKSQGQRGDRGNSQAKAARQQNQTVNS